VTITSCDGHKCGVGVQINTHPVDARPYQLNEIADRWCIARDDILNVLTSWTPQQLVEHLSSKTKADLMPPRGKTGGGPKKG
jgi:hypothetical protein